MNLVTQWGYNPLGIPSQIPSGYCNVPGGLSFVVAGTTVRLSWTSPHDYAAYLLEYRKVGTVPKTAVTVYGANTKIEGLDPNQAYEWWISTVCDIATNRKSTAVQGGNFTTGAATIVRDIVTALEISVQAGHTKADLTWTGSVSADVYEIYYKPVDFGELEYTVLNSRTPAIELTNLFSDMNYEVRIDSIYGTDVAVGEVKTFKTLALTLSNINNLKAFPESESCFLTWTPVPGATSYNILINDVVVRAGYIGSIFTLVGLTPETIYKATVIANADFGTSQPASVTFTTIGKAVDPVTNLAFSISGRNIIATWTKNPLADEQIVYVNGTSTVVSAATQSLTIPDALPESSYTIAVVASLNGKTSESRAIKVIMSFYVQTPNKPYLIQASKTELAVAWKPCLGLGLTYDLEMTDMVTNAVTTVETANTNITKTGLVSNRAYRFRVRAKTTTLTGAWSDTDIFTTSVGVTASSILNLQYTNPKVTAVTVGFELGSGLTSGVFNINFASAGHPTIDLDTEVTQGNEITGLIPGVTYDVVITNTEPDSIDSTLASIYVVPASIGALTGLGVTVSADKKIYTIAGTGVVGATYRFRYRVIGDSAWISLGTYDTVAKSFNLISGHYEFEVVMIKNSVETAPQVVAVSRFSPYGVVMVNNSGKLYVTFQRILSKTGFALNIQKDDVNIIDTAMGETGGIVSGLPYGMYKLRIKNLYDDSYSDTQYVSITADNDILFTSDIYECVGCCDVAGATTTVLKTYAQTIAGPQTFTIPARVNAFSITNLGNGSKVYQPIGITGITGLSEIPANLRVYSVEAESDSNILEGTITVAPASGHSVFITYLM